MKAETRHVHSPHFEWTKFEFPGGVGMEQIKETQDRMRLTAEATMEAFQKTCATAANAGAEWNAKLAEAVRKNLAAGFELAGDLAAAKSFPEMIEVSTAHARKQVEAVLAQNKELWTLGQKIMTEAAKPITGLAKTPHADASS